MLIGASVGAWLWAAAGHAENTPAGSGSNPPGGTAMAAQLVTASVKVDKVDLEKRELMLRSDDNKRFTVDVPEGVSRLDNVQAGDRVQVSFYESVAMSLSRPGETQPPGRQQTTTTTRSPGALPAGSVMQKVTTRAKITNVSPSTNEVTIERPDGKTNTIKVQDPEVRAELGRLKVGDQVQTTYTQAMATRVTSARGM